MRRTRSKLHQLSNARFLMEVKGVRAAAEYLQETINYALNVGD